MQLVIDKFGASVSVKDGMFNIKTDEESRQIPVNKIDSILITRSASISTPAIKLAVENGIEMIFTDRGGKPFARIWSNKFGSISTIRRKQLEFSRSTAATGWVKKLVIRKLDNQLALLFSLIKPDGEQNSLINKTTGKIEELKKKARLATGETTTDLFSTLRGFEGSASRWYFKCISECLPQQYRFEGRSQHPAFDMFNSMLNYAYGILYHKVESALIKAGVDPYIGVMHRDEYNRPVLTYDFIESFRVWADFVVVDLLQQEVIFREFFSVDNGVYYLETPGKRILINSFNDYLSEIIKYKKLERSRNTQIDLSASEFASFILKLKL